MGTVPTRLTPLPPDVGYRVTLGMAEYAVAPPGTRPATLTEALRLAYGTGDARVFRHDGTLAVRNAGSATEPWHVTRAGHMRGIPRRTAPTAPTDRPGTTCRRPYGE